MDMFVIKFLLVQVRRIFHHPAVVLGGSGRAPEPGEPLKASESAVQVKQAPPKLFFPTNQALLNDTALFPE